VQARCVGGGKAVGDPPTGLSPKSGHWVHNRWGAPNSRPVQEYWGQERACLGETKVGGKAHPRRGEAANRS